MKIAHQSTNTSNRDSATVHSAEPARPRRAHNRRRGAAVVEFALVVPLFFVLIFGMIEYGRLVMVQQMLTNASREGARVGILDNRTATDVTNAADQYLAAANITGSTVSVSPNPPSSATSGNPVTVTVSVPFDQVSWLPSPMFLGSATMTATTAMRRETME